MNYFIILLFIAPFVWRISTNYKYGVCWAVFLLTALSANPVLLTGGVLPNFNLQRLVLIVLLVAALKKNQLFQRNHVVPLKWALMAYAAVNLLPFVYSIDPIMSIKAYLAFTIEIVLFYIIVSTSIDSREDAKRVLFAGTSALAAVAGIALIERYTGFNPVDAFMPGYVRKPEYVNDILSTFPHRILFGTAMAIGWPLMLAFAQGAKVRRWIWWAGLCIVLLSCYLSFSRGPWVAAFIGGIIMFLFGGRTIRRLTITVCVLISIVLVLKPGVWETLSVSARETTESDSFKGQTYLYRWELWGIAWSQISISGTRMMFGFGQGSTEVMTFDAVLSYSGETTKLWSWDNHFAATLMESGCVGLVAFVGLYILFFMKIFSMRKFLADDDKTIHAAIMAAMTVMIFMMTNVAMFAPQLNYLLWSCIAAGFGLGMGDVQEETYVDTARS